MIREIPRHRDNYLDEWQYAGNTLFGMSHAETARSGTSLPPRDRFSEHHRYATHYRVCDQIHSREQLQRDAGWMFSM